MNPKELEGEGEFSLQHPEDFVEQPDEPLEYISSVFAGLLQTVYPWIAW